MRIRNRAVRVVVILIVVAFVIFQRRSGQADEWTVLFDGETFARVYLADG